MTREPKTGQLQKTRDRILAAAAEIISDHGYRSLTIDQIVKHSGVARSTIYRHWTCVPEIAMDAFQLQLVEPFDPPNTGNVRTDLVIAYRRMAWILENTAWGKAVASMVEAASYDENFEALLDQTAVKWRETLLAVLANGAKRGDVPDLTGFADEILDPLVGAISYRLFFTKRLLLEEGTIEFWVNAMIDAAIKRHPE